MFIRNFWPGIVWGIFVLILSAVPGNYFPQIQRFSNLLTPDKLVHFFLYAVFCYLVLIGIIKHKKSYNQYTLLVGVLLIILWGGLMEIMQHHIFIRRNGNIYDFFANSLGCALAYVLILYLERKKTTKSN